MRKVITKGTKEVRISGNEVEGYRSTLFLNKGETITNLSKYAKTLKGAEKQAAGMFESFGFFA